VTDAFDLNVRPGAMLIDYKTPPLARRKKIRARQEIAGDRLQMSVPETAPGDEVVFRGDVHAEVTGDRGQGTGKTSNGFDAQGLASLSRSL